ncbi:MAG: hypothetical protein KKB30_09365 [Proteobacteria bacterium]|nr:hypothetical protein [Pseudomonadota bacterium]MBU1714131.1 hypothetical protein [Pseudomonadota bacterium]
MSYHQGNTWQDQQREGIESVLSGAEIQYYYLDAKRNHDGAQARAEEAFNLFQNFKPDAIITADDHAQLMFVVPYLKDKVKTPVIFMGVNNDATKYGFPATNVTGIVEIKHVREGLNFAQLIDHKIKKVAVIYKDNLSNELNVEQLKKEQADYSIKITKFIKLKSMSEAVDMIKTLQKEVDAIFSLNLTGLINEQGEQLETTTSMAKLSLLSQIPIIGAESFDIESGALCGIIKTGQEQGATAARMVYDILNGKNIRDIPITSNKNGQRYINVTTAKRLGIKLDSAAIRGSVLVR